MRNPFAQKVSEMFTNATKTANDFLAQRETDIVRGRVAGKAVYADNGELIIDAGTRVTDSIIELAQRSGKLHALAAAVGTGGMQDLKETFHAHHVTTTEGQEAQSMDTIDDAAEARKYVGRVATVDVTDIRGDIIIPAGKEIRDEDVFLAREKNLLGALLYSAKLPDPPVTVQSNKPVATHLGPGMSNSPERKRTLPDLSGDLGGSGD